MPSYRPNELGVGRESGPTPPLSVDSPDAGPYDLSQSAVRRRNSSNIGTVKAVSP